MMSRTFGLATAILILASSGPLAGQRQDAESFAESSAESAREAAPLVVSPGVEDPIPRTAGSCPLFLWTGVEGALVYELRIHEGARQPELLAEQTPVIEVEVPGGATGWSPPGARCLEPGIFSWAVRGRTADAWTAWSEAGRFEIPGRPTADEVAWAADLLERYLEDSGASRKGADPAARRRVAAVPSAREPEGASTTAVVRDALEVSETYSLRVDGVTVVDVLRFDVSLSGLVFAGAVDFLGDAQVANITATSLDASPGFLLASQALTLTDTVDYGGSNRTEPGGGAGFFQIPSLTSIDVDDNTHTCADGGFVRGLALVARPDDQLAFDLICTCKRSVTNCITATDS